MPGLEPVDVEAARGELSKALESRLVDYPAVRRNKKMLLRRAWVRFAEQAADDGEFAAFRREEADWLDDYVLFRWLMDQAGGRETWDLWPEAYSTPDAARRFLAAARERDAAAVDGEMAFYAWVQWICFRQWREVHAHADERGVKLMGDIPIGVSYYSHDVFFHREQFDLEWCGGAPPETMFKHDRFIQQWGQNWGIPLYRWDVMEKDGFRWWRQRIGKLTEVFHIFRIDHVLGFYRIYSFPWRPQRNDEFLDLSPEQARKRTGGSLPGWAPRPDDTDKNKAANRADGDLRLKVVVEAAGDGEVVAEDLGCVPEYVRPHLESLDIAGFRIPHWDADHNGVVAGERFPECSFATYATHDHDTIAAMWEAFRVNASRQGRGARARGGRGRAAQPAPAVRVRGDRPAGESRQLAGFQRQGQVAADRGPAGLPLALRRVDDHRPLRHDRPLQPAGHGGRRKLAAAGAVDGRKTRQKRRPRRRVRAAQEINRQGGALV